jgi:hypothetical protein
LTSELVAARLILPDSGRSLKRVSEEGFLSFGDVRAKPKGKQ